MLIEVKGDHWVRVARFRCPDCERVSRWPEVEMTGSYRLPRYQVECEECWMAFPLVAQRKAGRVVEISADEESTALREGRVWYDWIERYEEQLAAREAETPGSVPAPGPDESAEMESMPLIVLESMPPSPEPPDE